MTDARHLTEAVLCAARRLTKSSASIEGELERTLSKCDLVSSQLCEAVAATLTKLCRDVSGAPLVVYMSNSDPKLLAAAIGCLSWILRQVRPEKLRSEQQLADALRATEEHCQKTNVPSVLYMMSALIITEIYWCFARLDEVLQPPYVVKERNARVLRARVMHFLRRTTEDLLVVSYSLLKLTACMHAFAEGCFPLRRRDKRELQSLLAHTVQSKRAVAVLLPQQREILAGLLDMARSSSPEDA